MRRPFWKTLRARLEAALVAAAFAEEREDGTARAIFSQAGRDADEERSRG